MKTEMPNIFEYIDYRKYLEDYYSRRKASDPGFTHTYICYRLGQENAKSYFNNVVKGRANVTATFVDRFIVVLELKKSDEAKYFRALVNYNQTTSPHEKEFFFDQLVRLNSTPHRVIDKNAYAFYREWYHSAIRALLDIVEFDGTDYAALAARVFPPITVKQTRDSVALLQRLGLITRNKKGYWKPTDKVVVTGDFIKDAVVKQFQMKCLEHAREVLASDTKQPHRNITLTISLSEKAYQQVCDRLQQVKTEIRSIVHKDEEQASRVYHLNANLFPMSQ
jgi:uncharacterized protein (TIGR02147 family)